MWIMVAGPYRSRTAGATQRAARLQVLNQAAVALHRAGHVPIIGVNTALPMIEAAGGSDGVHEEFMLSVSLALAERCDACLRIGGHSAGADAEVERFKSRGRPVYHAIGDIPAARTDP